MQNSAKLRHTVAERPCLGTKRDPFRAVYMYRGRGPPGVLASSVQEALMTMVFCSLPKFSLMAEKGHVLAARSHTIAQVQQHNYPLSQLVPATRKAAPSRFRFRSSRPV
jgi:hypothetical protein